jgi:hypothetical protein
MLQVLADRSSPDLRLQAALALAEFTDFEGVPTTLGSLALDAAEPIDLRHSAFTSLELRLPHAVGRTPGEMVLGAEAGNPGAGLCTSITGRRSAPVRGPMRW